MLLLAIFALFSSIRPSYGDAAPTAVVLNDPALPHNDASLGQTIEGVLRKAGYAPVQKTMEELMQPQALSPTSCALLVLPDARELPASFLAPFTAYLHAGGHLMAFGLPAWQTVLVKNSNDRWVTAVEDAESHALITPPHPVFEFQSTADVLDWTHSNFPANDGSVKDWVSVTVQGHTAGALHVTLPQMLGWDTYVSPELTSPPFPDGQTLTVFSAKGGPLTPRLSLEWDEKDGSRWIAVVTLTTHWQRYVVPPSAFHYWESVPARSTSSFHPENAVKFSVGLAQSHTGTGIGKQEWSIAEVGTAKTSELTADTDPLQVPIMDSLAPAFEFFPIHGQVKLSATPGQEFLTGMRAFSTRGLSSAQPRPAGGGFEKERNWRWISLLQAADSKSGEWRGTPAALFLYSSGNEYAGGAWASFTIADPAFYKQPKVLDALSELARRMRDGLFLMEAGAQYYTYFPGQEIRLGARVSNLCPKGASGTRRGVVRMRVTSSDGRVAWQKSWPLQVNPGENETESSVWKPSRWPSDGYKVMTELIENGKVIDRLQHDIYVWKPAPHPDWVRIHKDGHFYLNGQQWRINGVNYMPSSGIGQSSGLLFERWLSKPAYDPQIIERDLSHIQHLGMNAVYIFQYIDDIDSQNLLDFLRRCRMHHLHAYVSLRPGVSNELMDYDRSQTESRVWDTCRKLIERYRLAQNDTVFSYEVDWEPSFSRFGRQKRTDKAWKVWVDKRYGGVSAAEKIWGVPATLDAQGNLTGPPIVMLHSPGGPETKMIAAYRHFLDDWLTETYGILARRIRAIAPHQYVSFRMTAASDPLWDDDGPSYQFEGLSRALDFLCPESYGELSQIDGPTATLFRIAYGRSVAPHEPILWAETGMSVWGVNDDDPSLLKAEGEYYRKFYQLAGESGSDGIFWWWYPGGFRVGENSDYGLINPDGTDRPATTAVRHEGQIFLHTALPPAPAVWLDYNRDDHPDGTVGVFRQLKSPFAAAVKRGQHPGLRSHTPVLPFIATEGASR
jgi:hypothetical protein